MSDGAWAPHVMPPRAEPVVDPAKAAEDEARRDLVSDLREYAAAYPQNDGSACVLFAADEIERLRADVIAQHEEIGHLYDDLDRAREGSDGSWQWCDEEDADE